MEKRIADKLYAMWLFREETGKDGAGYDINNARLNGAISLVETIGFSVEFNPLADEKENPFTVKEIK